MRLTSPRSFRRLSFHFSPSLVLFLIAVVLYSIHVIGALKSGSTGLLFLTLFPPAWPIAIIHGLALIVGVLP